MANTTYLMMDEKRNFALFKVGFTSNMENRIKQYTTHNPMVQCISTVQTQEKTGRDVEKQFHDEIEKKGYDFVVANIDGKTTEWFKVAYNDPFYEELMVKGLKAFQCGKARKDKGNYTKR